MRGVTEQREPAPMSAAIPHRQRVDGPRLEAVVGRSEEIGDGIGIATELGDQALRTAAGEAKSKRCTTQSEGTRKIA